MDKVSKVQIFKPIAKRRIFLCLVSCGDRQMVHAIPTRLRLKLLPKWFVVHVSDELVHARLSLMGWDRGSVADVVRVPRACGAEICDGSWQ